MPYFSILLPTKNRSYLVGFAIRSVLQQSFDDFEVLVCDNDDDSYATKLVVEQFNDDRVKYIRTGGLDMVDNWNAALNAASGENVTVLEDKMIFYPNALLEIKSEIEQSKTGVVVWHTDAIEDSSSPAILTQLIASTNKEISNKDLLALVSKDVMKNWTKLPRGLSCVVPSLLIEEIKQETAAEFYERISPDFVSAVKILAHVDSISIVNKAFSLFVSKSTSNGRMVSKGNEKVLKYFFGNKQAIMRPDFVAVKNMMIVSNNVVNDYRKLSYKYGGILKKYSISNKIYVELMTRELFRGFLTEKRITWGREDVVQLLMSDRRPVRNILTMLSYLFFWVIDYTLRKIGVRKLEKNYKIFHLEGSPLDMVDDFLMGKSHLGLWAPF
jgi:glycosyltransferase involved in cell wall biosynthesis